MLNYPLISILILNWNRPQDTQKAIASAYKQTYPNFEIILVDNGSTDNSISLTKQNYPDIRIINLDKNYGCPGGRNLGVKHCNGEFIFYLDNDGELHQEAVMNAYQTISKDDKIAIVTGSIYNYQNQEEIDVSCQIKSRDKFKTATFQGGICLHRKIVYNFVGLFPDHFMYGGEETFMSLKLLDSNFQIIKDEAVVLWHKQSEVARNRENELLNSYFNKLYIAVTLYPTINFLAYVPYFLVVYPFYAYKNNFFLKFIQSHRRLLNVFKSALRNRTPVNSTTFKISKTKDVHLSISTT